MPRLFFIAIAVVLSVPAWMKVDAQEENVPLGDLAREIRHSKPPDETKIIDNDNFTLMMDKAESERLDHQPVFAISPSGRTFTTVSPDGTCSLSFVATSANRSPAAYIASDLPQNELLKLDGPASIADGSLRVSIHNGTQWEIKEIVVGVTVLQSQSISEYHPAIMGPVPVTSEKPPDLTVLYHLKGNSSPDTSTVFRGPLGGNFSDSKDWHWSIVGARGIPPAAPASIPQSLMAQMPSSSPPSDPAIQSHPEPGLNGTTTPTPQLSAPPTDPQK